VSAHRFINNHRPFPSFFLFLVCLRCTRRQKAGCISGFSLSKAVGPHDLSGAPPTNELAAITCASDRKRPRAKSDRAPLPEKHAATDAYRTRRRVGGAPPWKGARRLIS